MQNRAAGYANDGADEYANRRRERKTAGKSAKCRSERQAQNKPIMHHALRLGVPLHAS